MNLLFRHKLLIGGVTLAAAASAGGAYAATQSDTNPRQAYLNDVARRLNVSPEQLSSAMKAALIDRLDAMVRTGQLTQAQASRIERRIKQGGPFPFFFGEGPGHLQPGLRGADGPLHAAASYLGLDDFQLMNAVGSGQSLAQVAKSHGKSVSGLEQAIITAEKARLDRLVSAGIITTAHEQKLLSRLSAKIDRLVNRTGFGRLMRGHGPGHGPMMPPPPGGASGSGPDFGPPPPTA